jgi:thiol-disulfide isomerase/thioredoxin
MLKIARGVTLLITIFPLVAVSQNNPSQSLHNQDEKLLTKQAFEKIFRTKDDDSVAVYLNDFLKKYPHASEEFIYRPDALYGNIAERMANQRKWDLYEVYRAKISDAEGGELDYWVASYALKNQQDLVEAEKLALRSLNIYEKIYKDSIKDDIKPGIITKKHSKIDKYGDRAYLYATLTNVNKHEVLGLPYAIKALQIKGSDDIPAYELYLKLMAKTTEPPKALPIIEEHYRAGNVNDDELPGIVAGLYFQIHGSSNNFESYYTSLHNQLIKAATTRIAKDKIEKPAPAFDLISLSGKHVKLSDLKGKTVVLDFWATWCVYCKKGFPAMQKVMAKYSGNKNVVFLFIDTQEQVPLGAREKQISTYLKANKYNFTVLLDKEREKIGKQ